MKQGHHDGQAMKTTDGWQNMVEIEKLKNSEKHICENQIH